MSKEEPKMRSKTASLSLTLGFAMLLSLAPRPAAAGNPCAAYPQVCRYTWDPASLCCIADPRFDCFDVCFSSATAPASRWQADVATPTADPSSLWTLPEPAPQEDGRK